MGPEPPATLALSVLSSGPATVPAASATITLEGPSPVKRTTAVGSTVLFESLLPGSYTVAVEGMAAGGVVVWYNEATVTVAAGSTTKAAVTAVSFVPSSLAITPSAPSVPSGQLVRLTWAATPGAASYVVEWGRGAGRVPASRTTTQTSIELDLGAMGVETVQVSPITRFANKGAAYTPLSITVTAPVFTLTITGTGTGSGRVTSTTAENAGAITCTIDKGVATGSCSASFAVGTVVSLSPVPFSGSAWTGWGGDCTGTTACQVTMTQSRTVSSGYTSSTFVLTVRGGGTGSGRVTTSSQPPYPFGLNCTITNGGGLCDVAYASGTVVTLTAVPDNGNTFAGWSGDCSGLGTCQVNMNAARNLTVLFNRSGD